METFIRTHRPKRLASGTDGGGNNDESQCFVVLGARVYSYIEPSRWMASSCQHDASHYPPVVYQAQWHCLSQTSTPADRAGRADRISAGQINLWLQITPSHLVATRALRRLHSVGGGAPVIFGRRRRRAADQQKSAAAAARRGVVGASNESRIL